MAISRIESNSIAPSQTLTTPIIATTMGVGGATPSGSGSGITFPATQSASTDANTLDDYEEGSWTPAFKNGGTATYLNQFGRYTKVGRFVFLECYIELATLGTASGALIITGLPFGCSNTAGTAQIWANSWASTAQNTVGIITSSNELSFYSMVTSGSVTVLAMSNIGGLGNMVFTLSYSV
jgi:hypothetical protein